MIIYYLPCKCNVYTIALPELNIANTMSKVLKTYRFDENTLDLIDELRVDLHLSNNSDVIRRALTLLKLASDNQKKGGAIMLKTESADREIIL
jgi:hypothetical protein